MEIIIVGGVIGLLVWSITKSTDAKLQSRGEATDAPEWARWLFIFIAVLAALLVLGAVSSLSAAAPDGIPGTVLSAGPVYQARQHVCFSRSDIDGRTCLTVAVGSGGRTYRRGEGIIIHRDCSGGACRLAGLSHR